MAHSQTNHDVIAMRTPRVDVVSCNRCGGALDVADRTNYTTCGSCGTRLRIERSATSLATIELDDLRTRTDDLERNVSVLRNDRRIERLDRSWELRRDEFLITSGDSEPRVPTLHGALYRLITALLPLGLVISGWFESFGGPVVTVLIGATVFGIVQAGIEGYKYNRYRAARTEYRSERSRLLAAMS